MLMYKTGKAAQYLGIPVTQMRSLDASGVLVPGIRTDAGRRYYGYEQLREFKERMGAKNGVTENVTQAPSSITTAKVQAPQQKVIIPAVASAIVKTVAAAPVLAPVVQVKHERGTPTTPESVQQLKDLITKKKKMEPFNKESMDWTNWYEDVEYWENKLETEEAVLKETQEDAANKEPELK